MALLWSTGIRQFVAQHGSYKRALQGGVMVLYSGTVPASADLVAGSYTNQLLRITLASGSYTPETQASAALTLSGSAGSLDTLTVGKSGETVVEIMGAAIPYNTDLTTTASDVVAQIQTYLSNPEYEVSSSGAIITVKSLMGSGIAQNGFILDCTSSGGLFEDCPQTFAGGVASVNGLNYLYGIAGVLTKASSTWSGLIVNTGTASYWRIYGPTANEWGAPLASTSAIRVQGTCGVGAIFNYNMSSTSLTAGQTHQIDNFNLEIPVS